MAEISFKVGEVMFLWHLDRKTFGVITSIELDGVGIMLPSGETVTRLESELEAPLEELREQLNTTIAKAMGR